MIGGKYGSSFMVLIMTINCVLLIGGAFTAENTDYFSTFLPTGVSADEINPNNFENYDINTDSFVSAEANSSNLPSMPEILNFIGSLFGMGQYLLFGWAIALNEAIPVQFIAIKFVLLVVIGFFQILVLLDLLLTLLSAVTGGGYRT